MARTVNPSCTRSRRSVPALCVILLASVSAAQTPVSFIQPRSLGACQSLATGDFNGDGNLDVVCAENTVSIWLGDGQGHFRETAQQLPYFYAQVVTGDFNGDGRTDLVVAVARTSSQIVLLPGNGDGTFGPQITISDIEATALATVRTNPNGPLDLVAAVTPYSAPPPYAVEVFPGNGDGTFQNPVSTGIMSSTNIAEADFNGDGIPDIVSIGETEYQSPMIQVVLGNADGSFGPPVLTKVSGADPFAVADFTGDGIPDLAWSGEKIIYVYQGNGDGTFSPGPVTSTLTGQVLLAADLNGDGRPDLVMAGIAIALNLGGGAFERSEWYLNPSGPSGVAGDFRNLSLPDLIVDGDYYENNGSGGFRAAPVALTWQRETSTTTATWMRWPPERISSASLPGLVEGTSPAFKIPPSDCPTKKSSMRWPRPISMVTGIWTWRSEPNVAAGRGTKVQALAGRTEGIGPLN